MANALRKAFAPIFSSVKAFTGDAAKNPEASFLLGARETKSAHEGVQPKSETYKTHYENK
jgi:hypothetical protein